LHVKKETLIESLILLVVFVVIIIIVIWCNDLFSGACKYHWSLSVSMVDLITPATFWLSDMLFWFIKIIYKSCVCSR